MRGKGPGNWALIPLPDVELVELARHKTSFYRQLSTMAGFTAITFWLLAPGLLDGEYETPVRVAAYVAFAVQMVALVGWLVFARRLRRLKEQLAAADLDAWNYIHAMEAVPAVVDVEDVDPQDPTRVGWSCQNCKATGDDGPMALIDAVGHAIAGHGDKYIGLDVDERRAAIVTDWQQRYRDDPQSWQWPLTAQQRRGMRVLPSN